MARKLDDKKVVKIVKPQRQKIIVAEGRVMGSPQIPFRHLYTEVVESKEKAIERVKELKEEYKEVDGLSVNFFSL